MRRKEGEKEMMRNEMRKGKVKKSKKEEKERTNEKGKTVSGREQRKGRKRRKGKERISRLFDGRSSTVRVLKLVHAARSTCGKKKLGVSTNAIR